MFSVKPLWSALTPGSVLTMNEAATIERSVASVMHALTKRASLNTSSGSLCLSSCFTWRRSKSFLWKEMKYYCASGQNAQRELWYMTTWKTSVGIVLLVLLLPKCLDSASCSTMVPSLRFTALNSLLPWQGEHTWYTIIPQGLWDYLFTATLTEADSLRSYSHGLITWKTCREVMKNNQWTMSRQKADTTAGNLFFCQ